MKQDVQLTAETLGFLYGMCKRRLDVASEDEPTIFLTSLRLAMDELTDNMDPQAIALIERIHSAFYDLERYGGAR